MRLNMEINMLVFMLTLTLVTITFIGLLAVWSKKTSEDWAEYVESNKETKYRQEQRLVPKVVGKQIGPQ